MRSYWRMEPVEWLYQVLIDLGMYHINDRTEEIETKERKRGQIFKFKKKRSWSPSAEIIDCSLN